MTLIQLGIENRVEGRTLAWALDFPGVFAYGADSAEALLRVPREMLRFESWLNLHTDEPWVHLDGLDLHIDETFEDHSEFGNPTAPVVRAFFRSDAAELSEEEARRALLIYTWQREELLAGLETLPADLLSRGMDGQPWAIEGILDHLTRMEFWYFSRLGLQAEMPTTESGCLAKLDASEKMVRVLLPELAGMTGVFESEQEKWSARKVVRRLLWHQRDHIDQIRALALGLEQV